MKKRIFTLVVLFLLTACTTLKENTPISNPIQPTVESSPIQGLAQAETRTIQAITVQVIFQKPGDGKLVLPITILGPDDSSIWEPGEAVIRLGEEIIPASEVVEAALLPSSDGGNAGTAHCLELRFDFPEVDPGLTAVQLEIPYVFSDSPEGEDGHGKVDGPWVFDIPVSEN